MDTSFKTRRSVMMNADPCPFPPSCVQNSQSPSDSKGGKAGGLGPVGAAFVGLLVGALVALGVVFGAQFIAARKGRLPNFGRGSRNYQNQDDDIGIEATNRVGEAL
jgi:hypothetical protein